jgi:hypothetical protein
MKRQTCALDILRNVPRCTFSRKQIEAITYTMELLGIHNLPTTAVMRTVEKRISDVCGVQSIRYKGAHGHLYYLNDLAAIIAQVRYHTAFIGSAVS